MAKTTNEIKDETKKAAKAVKEEMKTAAKKTADGTKAAKEAVKKTAKEAEEKAASAKKTIKKAETKTIEAAKKAKGAAKKAADKLVTKNVYFEYADKQVDVSVLTDMAEKAYVAAGGKKSSIKSISLYVKAEDNALYYVVNDKQTGKVEL